MDHSIKVYWILFSIGNCGYCFPFLSNQNEMQVIEGNSMNLTCHISSDVIHCVWFHTNKSFSISSFNKPQYNIFGNHSNGECHLYIHNAKLETDNGLWTCQLTNINKFNISSQIHLTVLPRDNAYIKEDSVKSHPGVFIGSFCAAIFMTGGLIIIILYRQKRSCCLAPGPGYTSRSMLIWNTLPQISNQDENTN